MRRGIWVLVGLMLVGCGGSGLSIGPTGTGQTARWAQGAPTPTAPPKSPASANGAVELTTWTDVDGRIRLSYPTTWKIGRLDGEERNVAQFTTPDTYLFFVSAFPNAAPPLTADTAIAVSIKTHLNSDRDKYHDNPVSTISIGGEDGRMLSSASIPRDNSTTAPSRVIDWAVVRGTTLWTFFAEGEGMWDRSNVDRVIASVAFLG